MPTHSRGADVRYIPVAEEDEAYQDHKDVVQEVVGLSFGELLSGSR